MPETEGQKIQRQIAAIKAQGGTDADVASFLSSHPSVKPLDEGPRYPKMGQMGKPIVDETPEDPSYAEKALGGLASMARDIPGVEALQAGAMTGGDLTKASDRAQMGQKYRDALAQLRGAEDSSGWVGKMNRVIGGTVAAAAGPKGTLANPLGTGGSFATQGARYGAARGALAADPMSNRDRILNTGEKAAVDAMAGKIAEGAGVLGRTVASRTVGRVAQLRRQGLQFTDKANFGKAEAEADLAAANPAPQAVSNVLDEKDIKPYTDMVRNSRTQSGLNPGRTLMETYIRMSARQQLLGKSANNPTSEFRPDPEQEIKDIAAAKREMLNASGQMIPSLRSAVVRHREMMGQMAAFKTAADATNRIVRGVVGSAQRIEHMSPEAWQEEMKGYTPEQAKAALQGVFSRLKGSTGANANPLSAFGLATTPNPVKGFGLYRQGKKINEMIPYIQELDRLAGNKLSSVPGLLGIGASGQVDSHLPTP